MNRKIFLSSIVAICLTTTFSCSSNYSNWNVSSNIDSAVSIDSLRYLVTSDRFQVLDLYRGSYDNNAKVDLYEFSGNGNQLWVISKVGKYYKIRSYFSKKVLAINPENSLLVQQDDNGNNNQLWLISGSIDSALIINKALGTYLTYAKYITIGNCTEKTAQHWIIQSYRELRKEMDTCNCYENFDFIKRRIETSYSGFRDKVNLSTKAEYEKLCVESEKAAKELGSTSKCFNIIQNYIDFFHDSHIHFNMRGNQNNKTKSIFYKQENIVNAEWFNLKNIDDSTLLLSLPSFGEENKFLIDDIISKNREKLLNTPYLIIDIRGNEGGDDASFFGILPFLYTNPFTLYGNDILASNETIKFYEIIVRRFQLVRNAISLSDEEWLKKLLGRMRKAPGEFVLRSSDHDFRLDKVLRNPRKIVILINKNCASSAEEFLLYARESKKVQLLGQPTSGTLDYSNVISVPCPSLVFKFGHATTRNHRLPRFSVDRDKIQPNIYLTYDTDWIAEAVKQFRR